MKKLLLVLAIVFAYGVGFHMSLLLFPLAIIGAILFGTTIGLLLTPIGMLYKDIAKIVTMGLSLLMYVTPVVYAIPKEGIMKIIMEWNPFTPFILTARDFVTGLEPVFFMYFICILLVCIPLFFIGLLFYRISIPIIVERLSA